PRIPNLHHFEARDNAESLMNRDGVPHTNGVCFIYTGHAGIDYIMSFDYVLAAHGGTVVMADWYNTENRRSGLGLHVEIQVTFQGDTYKTRYAHLSTLMVQTGQSIT